MEIIDFLAGFIIFLGILYVISGYSGFNLPILKNINFNEMTDENFTTMEKENDKLQKYYNDKDFCMPGFHCRRVGVNCSLIN